MNTFQILDRNLTLLGKNFVKIVLPNGCGYVPFLNVPNLLWAASEKVLGPRRYRQMLFLQPRRQ